jgi:hypothetical protein
MNWWISIVFYLWRNSLRRWLEQPLGLLSKLLIAALIGGLGALVISGAAYLGDELDRQLSSRDALAIMVTESVSTSRANAMISPEDTEEAAWAEVAVESIVLYQSPVTGAVEAMRELELIGLRNPEIHGYPETLVLISERRPPGETTTVNLDGFRVEALILPPTGKMAGFGMQNEFLIAPLNRIAPLLQRGFFRKIHLQVASLEEMRRVHDIVDVMKTVENRRINIISTRDLLERLALIRKVQGYVLLTASLGSALVLGLTCGALAWMEFREDRYLLALIRSFGIGRPTLLMHSVMENCMVAVFGVICGLAAILLAIASLDLDQFGLAWLQTVNLSGRREIIGLIFGAFCGGLLSCLPIGIGLHKPLGLVLK